MREISTSVRAALGIAAVSVGAIATAPVRAQPLANGAPPPPVPAGPPCQSSGPPGSMRPVSGYCAPVTTPAPVDPAPEHAQYLEKSTGVRYTIARALTWSGAPAGVSLPAGMKLVAFYMTASNGTSKDRAYHTGEFIASSSRAGRPFKVARLSAAYPQLTSGTLPGKGAKSGWVGYQVPQTVGTVFLRVSSGKKTGTLLLTYRTSS